MGELHKRGSNALKLGMEADSRGQYAHNYNLDLIWKRRELFLFLMAEIVAVESPDGEGKVVLPWGPFPKEKLKIIHWIGMWPGLGYGVRGQEGHSLFFPNRQSLTQNLHPPAPHGSVNQLLQ